MNILTGLFDNMVLQRNARGFSDQTLTGETTAEGEVSARVIHKNKPVRGYKGERAGKAAGGKFSASLKGIPVGGPYRVEISVAPKGSKKPADAKVVKGVLVGDVWIAGGQSNMQGCGRRAFAAKPMPAVRAFYMNDVWDIAQDPIHNMWDCVDQVHIDLCGGARPGVETMHGVGPAVAFAQEVARSSGVPQGILACAHGGTTMMQWDPARGDEEGKSLYGATLRRVRKNGGRVAGMVWYQGESDATDETAAHYTDRMKMLVAAFRKDLKTPAMPVAIVQIGRVLAWGSPLMWNSVQDQQRRLPRVIKNLATVPAIDLGLSDSIHIDGPDMQRLGKRLAVAMEQLRGEKMSLPALEVGKISVETIPGNGLADVVVEFKNVIGKLQSTGPARGLAISGGNDQTFIYRIDLEGNKARCKTNVMASDLDGKSIHYGRGVDPVCTITDEADRSIPVFGPILIASARPVTSYINRVEVSHFTPGAGNLGDLEYPDDRAQLEFKSRDFAGDFLNVHSEIASRAADDPLVFFRLQFSCPEPMKLSLHLGYDGPIKTWIDRQQIFHDPAGKNPAAKDMRKLKIDTSAGDHELLIALAGNAGRAWGVFVRFERLDVTRDQLNKQTFVLPKMLT